MIPFVLNFLSITTEAHQWLLGRAVCRGDYRKCLRKLLVVMDVFTILIIGDGFMSVYIYVTPRKFYILDMCSFVVVESLSYVRLFSNPMDCSPQGFSVLGIPRWEYWSGLPFPSPGCVAYTFILHLYFIYTPISLFFKKIALYKAKEILCIFLFVNFHRKYELK